MSLLPKPKSRRTKVRTQAFSPEEVVCARRDRVPGYAKMPRTMPLLMSLFRSKAIVDSMDCDRVYLELVSRDFGDGIIETADEKEHAFGAGYTGMRSTRSWRERVAKLIEVGAVVSKPKSGRQHGYLLLVDPDLVVFGLEGKVHDTTETELVDAYWRIRQEVGADVHDAADLQAGILVWRLLRKLGHQLGVGEPTRGIEGRKVQIQHGPAVRGAALSDGDILACLPGPPGPVPSDWLFGYVIGAERWSTIKERAGSKDIDRSPFATAADGGAS